MANIEAVTADNTDSKVVKASRFRDGLVSFGAVVLLAGAAAVPLFRDETPRGVLANVDQFTIMRSK